MAQVPVQDMAHTARMVPAAGMVSAAGRVSRRLRPTSLLPHGMQPRHPLRAPR